MKKILLILFIPCIIFASDFSNEIEDSTTNKKVRVQLGAEYEASGLYEFFMGEHWRELWTTEIELPVLDLETYAGGLTPIKKGGSFQTKSLRFLGVDGKQYKFRSINKDPTQTLSVELKNSIIAEVLKDQTSISNPVAALIVPKLLDAVGVLNAHPKMFILPDDERLGKFREEFAGLPGTIEENLKSKKNGKGGFGKYTKIITGFDIYEKTRKNNKNRVDEVQFLKARLMDVLIGDRDRHGDQWKWAAYSKNGVRYWLPVPRDRDFAFCLYDGLFPEIASRFEPSSIGYGKDFPSMKNQTYIGRHLDRRFMNSLTKEKWDSIAVFIKNKLTDEVIKAAVSDIPEKMYAKKGEFICNILKIRRDKLPEITDEYYNLLYRTADVYGTDKAEFFEVKRIKDNIVEVKIYELNNSGIVKDSIPVFSRTYNSDETKEIRIYMLNGKNKVVVSGEVNRSILVRVVGGKDKDVMIDISRVKGYFLDFTPIPQDEVKTEFYDSGKKTKFKKGSSTYINKYKVNQPETELQLYEPNLDDRYGFFYVDPAVGYNTNDGAIIGINPVYTKYGFREDPYLYSLSFSVLYATDLDAFDLIFTGNFNNTVYKTATSIKLEYSQMDVIDFYGLGNKTEFSKSLYKNEYYRIEQKYVFAELKEEFRFNDKSKIYFGLSYEYSEITERDSSFLAYNRRRLSEFEKPYGFGKNSYLRLGVSYNFDSRNNIYFPDTGFYLDASARYYPKVFNNPIDFSILRCDIRKYFSFNEASDMVLALRLGAQKNIGNYPFFKAAHLGGVDNLSGFVRERFSGDGYIFGQTDMRVYLSKMNFLVPGKIGFNLLGETGRVFLESEKSERWHFSFGLGIWITILDDLAGINFSVFKSRETANYYLNSRFAF